ncbi:MAG: glycerophosphodiester phosphodiesterase family protein, partial [Gammaproteobacteria bacterium]
MTSASSPRLLCIGHRGAMGHAPENTLGSVKAALALGVRHLEIDVYCVEGELLVFHDDRLERTTNGTGRIRDQSLSHLRSLDAGGGQQIPTLEEVCTEIAGKACLNIELKGPGTARPVARLINQLIARGWHHDCFLVSSFDHRQLAEMGQMEPRIKLGALLCG